MPCFNIYSMPKREQEFAAALDRAAHAFACRTLVSIAGLTNLDSMG
jgi:hypothetical protein